MLMVYGAIRPEVMLEMAQKQLGEMVQFGTVVALLCCPPVADENVIGNESSAAGNDDNAWQYYAHTKVLPHYFIRQLANLCHLFDDLAVA